MKLEMLYFLVLNSVLFIMNTAANRLGCSKQII